jgi:hypothetical protein
MLDEDLAALYGVETRSLVRAVKRNIARFPEDFMFQLTSEEVANLRSQAGISSSGHGGRRYAPYAFTEHGVPPEAFGRRHRLREESDRVRGAEAGFDAHLFKLE